MNKVRVFAVLPIALTVIVAGCGSSSKSNSTNKSATPAAATGTSSSSGRAYGSSATGATTAPAALITTKHDSKLGTILAYGPKRLTVYLFESDRGAASSCSGACASVWPPVTGKPQAMGAAARGDLGTITRTDGARQVTYKGHPLYLFVKDKDDGDAYGEGIKQFGAEWYALRPTGEKADLS